jgi:DNA repair protein RadC
MSIKDWPVSERPREKLLANGAHHLSDAELLAVLVGSTGRRGCGAVTAARNAAVLMLAHPHPLCCREGVTTWLRVNQFAASR